MIRSRSVLELLACFLERLEVDKLLTRPRLSLCINRIAKRRRPGVYLVDESDVLLLRRSERPELRAISNRRTGGVAGIHKGLDRVSVWDGCSCSLKDQLETHLDAVALQNTT